MARILILGGSGFIGNALYKEFCSYFDTYATYFTNKSFSKNQHFFNFDFENDSIEFILKETRPTHIISALRGDFEAQIETHREIASLIKGKKCKLIFLSSANVFDAFSNYPSYEYDKTLSESVYGKLKIKIENLLMRLPESNYVIARLPMVFGYNSPRIRELRSFIDKKEAYEVFPDLVMNVTSIDKLTQQLHYIINRNRKGVFHLGSFDLIHHDEYIKEVTEKLGYENPLFKNVYTSNFDRFLAVLPKDNLLPLHLRISSADVIENSGTLIKDQ